LFISAIAALPRERAAVNSGHSNKKVTESIAAEREQAPAQPPFRFLAAAMTLFKSKFYKTRERLIAMTNVCPSSCVRRH
jgi:hypothetical protein